MGNFDNSDQNPHFYLQNRPNRSDQQFNDIHRDSSQLITRITIRRMFKIICERGNKQGVSFPCLSQ